MHAKLSQPCLTLCDPIDCSSPDSSAHGILQTRVLEWVALPSSRGSPNPGIELVSLVSPALWADSLPLNHGGSPELPSVQFSRSIVSDSL